MRDAFIGGQSDSFIRQRLLEKELHFQETVTKAKIFDRDQRHLKVSLIAILLRMGKLEYSVLLLHEVSSLFKKKAICVERSLTIKE